ncbi:hypothetical protein SAMN04489712_1591, partial [Thermomonospora echinospora]
MNEHTTGGLAAVTTHPGTVQVIVPDLGEDAPTWETLEETLATLRGWESDPPRQDLPPMRLPAPIAGGAALEALQRTLPAVLAVTGQRAAAAGLGTLRSPAEPGNAWGIAAGRMTERMPLRIIYLPAADAAVLARLPGALAAGDPDVADAAGQVLDAHGIIGGEDPAARLADHARRLTGLLDVELDDAERALADAIAATPATDDVVLTCEQHAVYRPLAARLLRTITGTSDPLDA